MRLILALIILFTSNILYSQGIFKTDNGLVKFRSDADMELIEASSNKLFGAIDTTKKTFSFVIKINSFEGFNGPLQKEHFNENYLESDVYKTATFNGKIIEDVPFNKPGVYSVRAKGNLTVHGVEQERIIKCSVVVKPKSIQAKSNFTVLLDDHKIRVPHVVFDKVAKEILVDIDAELKSTIK